MVGLLSVLGVAGSSGVSAFVVSVISAGLAAAWLVHDLAAIEEAVVTGAPRSAR